MPQYRVEPPFIDDMGSISPFTVDDDRGETKEERALWTINSMRRHDHQRELDELPKGFVFTRLPRQR